jgi:hypothetical protein
MTTIIKTGTTALSLLVMLLTPVCVSPAASRPTADGIESMEASITEPSIRLTVGAAVLVETTQAADPTANIPPRPANLNYGGPR